MKALKLRWLRRSLAMLSVAVVVAVPMPVLADAETDRQAFVNYFQNRFPTVELDDFANGVYAIDAQSREQWEAIEEFPPYEEEIEKGEVLFNTPFANGKGYSDCFADNGAVRHQYPFYDTEADEVITLEYDINRCRKANGEKPLKWERGDIVSLSAYMAYQSRGKRLAITIPNAAAQRAYESGQKFYYSKRGYLNNSCATCHVQGAGLRVRTEVLHPALGEITNWPTHRLKWGHTATLHKRIRACHRDQGTKHFKAQSPQYREVEYFMSYMGNGLPVNGPGVRK
ncbi:MAG: sulfur oxidation c-type cytochrome SoxA [Proteobacteria bacterium]|nr:sulfur oxidation c-type cytochrome SoxA [Pseudomonadota bacterium]